MTDQQRHCGYVALIGAPNAGKSTLLNALVGSKVSIVSHKVQTTRALIRGIVMEGESQIIFVDTPGIFAPRRRLDRAMVSSAWGGAGDADVVALLVDARKGEDEETQTILERLGQHHARKVLILNKIDTFSRDLLLPLAASLNARLTFEQTFMLSALKGDGVRDFIAWLATQMPHGPWLYPEDDLSDVPLRKLAAEITREKLFERLHQELPYHSTVETTGWQAKPDNSIRIEQTIYVERDSQRKIVLGRQGSAIKAISMASRRELEQILETRIHLFLTVKVEENWGDHARHYQEMGLEFPK